MSIFAISDLHLSFGTDKPMNVFGNVWENYEEKIANNWKEQVNSDDTVIIPGDISWGIDLKEALPDFKYINDLPGQKIILRGNHDYYFSTKTKLENFFKENNLNTLTILHNNAIELKECILCGTRGWGNTEGSDKKLDKKIIEREKIRLRLSLDEGKKLQDILLKEKNIKKDIIVVMHFPPFISSYQAILKEYNVKMCIYGHLHRIWSFYG